MAVMAGAEAGPVLATVAQADSRGLATTRLLYVAELLRSRLECGAHHTTHNVNEDSPGRGRASATAMICFAFLLPADLFLPAGLFIPAALIVTTRRPTAERSPAKLGAAGGRS